MRNTLEYPITLTEVKLAVETALMREDDDDSVGSIDAFILNRILQLVDKCFTEEDFK